MLHLGAMAKMQQLTCDEKTRRILEQRRSSQTELHRNVFRARMILGCLDGRGVMELARALNTRPNTVIKWRDRFAAGGLAGLEDRPRPGAPRQLPPDLREQILGVLEESPPLDRRSGMVVPWPGAWAFRHTRYGGFCGRRGFACNGNVPGALAPIRSSWPKPPILSGSIWRPRPTRS